MDNFTLYMHIVPNGKKYVGITKRKPTARWNGGSGYCSNEDFHNDIRKYGWSNIQHKILREGMDKEEAEYWEMKLIELYDTMNPEKGYNRRKGGSYGEISPETLAKIKKRAVPHNGIKCICIETKREFKSVAAAARSINANRNAVFMSCLSNGVQAVKGKHFVYSDSEKAKEMDRNRVMAESFNWEWEW